MGKVADFIFRRNIQKQNKAFQRTPRFVTYQKANTFLLLFRNDTVHLSRAIETVIKNLVADGKSVIVWVYATNKHNNITEKINFSVFSNKDISFFKHPTKAILEKIQETPCDILIDFSLQPTLPLSYLSLYSPATFKIGTKATSLPIYDFILNIKGPANENEPEKEIDELFVFEQLKLYLKNIQSND